MYKKLSFISVLYLIAWCISPPLAYGGAYRMAAIAALILIIITTIRNSTPSLRKNFWIGVSLCIYMLLISIITGENYTFKIGVIIIIMTAVLFPMWNEEYGDNQKYLEGLIVFTLLLFCIWNTTTLFAINQFPRIMRYLVKNTELSEYYAIHGVGGYGYMYSVIASLPIGFCLIKEKYSYIIRLIILYFVVSSVMLAYLSQYFIALILCVLILPMMALASKYRNGLSISTYIIGILILFVLFFYLESILDFLINIVHINTIKEKLIGMKDTLVYGDSIEDSEFGERYERYTRDLKLILHSPIWGVLKFGAVGKHSNILDFFAQYGIPLGIVYIKTLFSPCNRWIKNHIPVAYVVLWIIVIIALMNSLPPASAVPLCFLLPAYCKLEWLKLQSSTIQE